MNIQEVATVLAKIKIGDNREVDRAVVSEWNDSIGDLDFVDAITAVTMHRRESLTYLMPAHIRANVRRIREERARQSAGELHILCKTGSHKLDVNGWCLLCHERISGLEAAS